VSTRAGGVNGDVAGKDDAFPPPEMEVGVQKVKVVVVSADMNPGAIYPHCTFRD
jgi:hypothetical protein